MLLGIQKKNKNQLSFSIATKKEKELKIFNDKTEKTNFIGMILDKSNRFKI